jgi:isopentenyl diphosphate isomerase/L-lactate dehydrogenase-like FMN-dependent dehydrogenase
MPCSREIHIEVFAFTQDVLLAIKAGMQGVVLSNHGGRQLVSGFRYFTFSWQSINLDDHNSQEFARSGIEVLVEVVSEQL